MVSADGRLPNVGDEPREPARHVIVSARISAAAELIRWLFERYQIPYKDEAHAPLLRRFAAGRRLAGAEVPVVVSAEATWTGRARPCTVSTASFVTASGCSRDRRRAAPQSRARQSPVRPAPPGRRAPGAVPPAATPKARLSLGDGRRAVVGTGGGVGRVSALAGPSRGGVGPVASGGRAARQHISEAASIVEQMLAALGTAVSRRSRARPDRHRLRGAGRSRRDRRTGTAARLPALDQLPAELRTVVDDSEPAGRTTGARRRTPPPGQTPKRGRAC